jgi:hypothetical protein
MPWAKGFPVLAAGKARVRKLHMSCTQEWRQMSSADGGIRQICKVILWSRHCECKFQKAYIMQCRHEIAAKGGTFIKEAFALHWWKCEALPPGIWDLDEDSLPAFETMGSNASTSLPSEENVGDTHFRICLSG